MHQRHSILLKTLCVLGWLHIIRRYTKTLKGFKRSELQQRITPKRSVPRSEKENVFMLRLGVLVWSTNEDSFGLHCLKKCACWSQSRSQLCRSMYSRFWTAQILGWRPSEAAYLPSRIHLAHRSVCTIFPQKCVGKIERCADHCCLLRVASCSAITTAFSCLGKGSS